MILILSKIIACVCMCMYIHIYIHIHAYQSEAFKVLQAIISESMRRIKNMFRQKFCEFKGDIR